MRIFIYGSDRGWIGTLARAVGTAALAGDPLAEAILREAVVELARLANALISRAGSKPVVFVGGVVGLHPLIRPALAEALRGRMSVFPRSTRRCTRHRWSARG